MTVAETKDDGERQEETNDEENPPDETKTDEPEIAVEAKEDETGASKPKQTKNNSGRGSGVSAPPFPKSFYDPVTQKLMLDPVVAPDGISHEKKDTTSDVRYYPNRALKAYIEHEVDRTESAGSMRGKFLEISESLRTGFQKLLEQSAIPSSEFKPLPEGFYCPISFDLIHDPVIDPDGHTYEREAIYHWIRANDDSPITRNPLAMDQLYENTTLLEALLELTKDEEEQNIHPSIRRWQKDESERIKNPTTAFGVPEGDGNNQETRPWPSNHRELNAAARRNRTNTYRCTVVAFMLAFVVAFLFFPSAIGYIMISGMIFFLCAKPHLLRQDEDQT